MSTLRSRKALWVTLAVAVPGALFALAYLVFFTPDSPGRLELSSPSRRSPGASSSPTTSPASGGSLSGTWKPVAGSVAGYRVREKLAKLPAPSDAVGRTEAITGTATLVEEDRRVQVAQANFEVDLTKLQSDEARRDNRIRTTGLETDRFPSASFHSSAPIAVPESAVNARPDAATVPVTGDLTIHGTTKAVTIPLRARRSGDSIELVGSLTFPFSDFNMEPPSVGSFVTVESAATLEFKLVLTRA